MSYGSSVCRNEIFAPCKGPPQLLPSIFADSLQAINAKFCRIVEVEDIVADTICARKVTGLDPPVDPTDATNKAYVDSVAGGPPGLPEGSIQFNNSGIFTGDSDFLYEPSSNTITMTGGTLTGLLLPINLSDAANKEYVDSAIGSAVAPPVNSVQFNNSGAFGGSSDFSWEDGTKRLTVLGTITDGTLSINSGDILGANDIDADGLVRFTDCTPSNNPTSGTLVICGGVGIGHNLHVAGKAFADKFVTTSDELLKTDIIPLENSLNRIRQIEAYSYRLKHDRSQTQSFGVMAQQLEKIGLSNLVDNSREYKSVDYTNLIALLIEAVQELDKNNSKNKLKDITKIVKELSGEKHKSFTGLGKELSVIIDSLTSTKVQELNKKIDVEINQKINRDIIEPLKILKDDIKLVKSSISNDVKTSLKKELSNVNRMKNDITNDVKYSVKDSLRTELSEIIEKDISTMTEEYKNVIVEKNVKKISIDVQKNIRKELQQDIEKNVKNTEDTLRETLRETLKNHMKTDLTDITENYKKTVVKDLRKKIEPFIDDSVLDSIEESEEYLLKTLNKSLKKKMNSDIKETESILKNEFKKYIDESIYELTNDYKYDLIKSYKTSDKNKRRKRLSKKWNFNHSFIDKNMK